MLNYLEPLTRSVQSVSISPDFNHLVTMEGLDNDLGIYDVSTGKHLVGANTGSVRYPWFTRDGREVWHNSRGQKIIRGGGSDVIGLEPLQRGDAPSGGYLWDSSHGHEVTDDGWILDSRKKRVMWLPHHWRVIKRERIWDERFLVLLGFGLLEPVIIELYE